MSSASRYLVALLICSFTSIYGAPPSSTKEGFYTIVVPGTMRSESLVHVSLALSDFPHSCWFNMSLISYSNSNQQHRNHLKTIEVHPNTIELVELQVPHLYSKRGHLEIVGYRGIITRDVADINFEQDSHSVFIQTNKAKYKPGEMVQFRVICIDQLTRPAQIKKMISVLIYDSEDNLIKHIADVKLVQGVFKGDLQLSENTILGDWKIRVDVGGNVAAERSFQVKKYVLPTFLVKISTKPNFAIDEKKIVLAISANYFYGEPVNGNLTIFLNKTYAAFNDKLPIESKELQINGKATITLDMKDDLQIVNQNLQTAPQKLYKFNVIAVTTDDLTEQQSKAETEFTIHSHPFKFKLQAPKVFDPEAVIEFLVKVSLTDLENKPIKNSRSPVKIKVHCNNHLTSDFDFEEAEFTQKIGQDHMKIHVNNRNFSECKLYGEYEGVQLFLERISKNEDTFLLDVLTESPEVGKELKVKLKSLDSIENFSYDIVTRGDIIKSEYINVPSDERTFVFNFNVTYAMVPKVTIYVHRVKKRIFAGQLKEVYIKRAFENSINIATDNETKPGSSVHIKVATDEGSYVGLMGLDHRIIEESSEKDDLTEKHFYTKLRNYDASGIDESPFPGINAGLITFSNAFTLLGSRFGEDEFIIQGILSIEKEVKLPDPFDKPTLEFPRIRKLFSESWLYKDFERTPAGGLNIIESVPDSITSWAITGFSLHPKTGLTLTKNATNLKVFQEFFVSIELPNVVREGETVEVPIYISNYLNQDALTRVLIEKTSDDIEILKQPDVILMPKEEITKLIPANKKARIKVFIRPLKPGNFNITIKALAPMASDAIQKTLNVKPEGVLHEISNTYLVHLPEEDVQEDEITIDIPDHAVSKSQNIEISIVGDIFRPLLRNLQKTARVPYGNGEDNMRFVVSNLLVLKYLKALNYTFPSLESTIRLNMELGYQNQMCFKHLDGSFGLFDRSTERSGDIWQTAFALWGLKQSKKFIHVDSKVFERGLDFLKNRQQANGCFKSRSGIEQDIEYTAISLMVFLMDDHWRTTHIEVITKGLKYLYEMADNLEQSSISVLSTYVLLLGRHEKAGDRLMKLASSDKLLASKMLWKKPDSLQSCLETTTDCLMNLFEDQQNIRPGFLHIIRGLIATDSGKTSLTHMIALHAMIVFVEDLNLNRKNLTTFFKTDQNESGYFQVHSGNSQVLQKLKLSDKSRRISLQNKGYGFAVVDVKYKYNLALEDRSARDYYINITTPKSSSNYLTVFEVCASVMRDESGNHLSVMEVNLQSGYEFSKRITPQIGLTWKFKSIEVGVSPDKLIVHIANINKKGICLKLEVLKKYEILSAKPGWVILYDTHRKGDKSFKSFKVNES